MQVTKNQKLAFAIGLVCVVLGPIIGVAANNITLLDQTGITITEDSQVSFQKVFSYNFSLAMGQSLTVRFSVHYENTTANLKIIGKGTFEQEYTKNTTNNPQTITGRNFLQANPGWVTPGNNPTAGTLSANASLTTDGFYYIEFMGNGASGRIWTEPGDYVLFVYGSNAGPVTETEVKFSLTVTIDGPGPTIATILNIVGWALIGLFALSLFLEYRKKILG